MTAPIDMIPIEALMATRVETVDPSAHSEETFDLFSIPAYDNQIPDTLTGSEIGSAKKAVQPGDVLLSRIVPHIRRAWVVPQTSGRRQIASGEWIVFRSNRIHPPYLRHLLMADVFHTQFMNTVAGVGGSLLRARPAFVAQIPIPLPCASDTSRCLSEQKRIADILDKAEAIREKRRDSLDHIDDLISACFMTEVGPCASGYDTWPTKSIAELANEQVGSMRTGPFGSDLRHSEFVEDGIAVLGIDNAVQNRFAWSERRFISEEKYEQLKRYRVYPGDVIITIMGTVGRSAVVPDEIPLAINTKHLACITLDRGQAEPEFLSQAIHRHPGILQQLSSSGRGAIMNGLNLGLIKQLTLPVPPIDIQRSFAANVRDIRRLEERLSSAARESEDLFDSLADRAFRGEL